MYIHMFHPGRKSPVKQNERKKRQIQPKQWRISSRRDGYVRISLWPFLGPSTFWRVQLYLFLCLYYTGLKKNTYVYTKGLSVKGSLFGNLLEQKTFRRLGLRLCSRKHRLEQVQAIRMQGQNHRRWVLFAVFFSEPPSKQVFGVHPNPRENRENSFELECFGDF